MNSLVLRISQKTISVTLCEVCFLFLFCICKLYLLFCLIFYHRYCTFSISTPSFYKVGTYLTEQMNLPEVCDFDCAQQCACMFWPSVAPKHASNLCCNSKRQSKAIAESLKLNIYFKNKNINI